MSASAAIEVTLPGEICSAFLEPLTKPHFRAERRKVRRRYKGFSFSPITNQSNDRLFLAGKAGENACSVFAVPFLGQDLFISSCLPNIHTLGGLADARAFV